jgi:hypothetical protein
MDSSFVHRTRIRGVALLAAVALALGLALTVAVVAFAPGAEADPAPEIHIVPLTDISERNEFTDDVRTQVRAKPDGRPMGVANLRDASNMVVLEITVEPGAMFPWHTHPGPVLVAVVEGDFEFIFADDCVRRPYKAGQAFVDLGKDVHMALNPSGPGGDDTVLIATFLAAPDEGPLTVPVDAEEGLALDEECDIDR